MKTEELKAQGLTDEQISFVMAENGKDIGKIQKRLDDAIAEKSKETERANNAEETLKGFEGKDFDAITKERDEWQKKAEQAKADYEAKEAKRLYHEAVENSCKELKFTSNSARKAFIAELEAENLKEKDGSLLGFTDFVAKYKEADSSAFLAEADGEKAKFTGQQGGTPAKADLKEADLRKAFGLPPKEN